VFTRLTNFCKETSFHCKCCKREYRHKP